MSRGTAVDPRTCVYTYMCTHTHGRDLMDTLSTWSGARHREARVAPACTPGPRLASSSLECVRATVCACHAVLGHASFTTGHGP